MRRHLALIMVVIGVLAALGIMLIVGITNGGDDGGDLRPPEIKPTQTSSD